MKARIYKPAKTAMQSGKARTKEWVLEYAKDNTYIEPLMGWTGTKDTLRQVKLEFATREEAIAYAQKKGIPFEVTEPHQPELILKSYADNFAFKRAE